MSESHQFDDMNVERAHWYTIDEEEGDGRQEVFVANVLQSYFDHDGEDGEEDALFVKLTDEVDEYGPMGPFWSMTYEEFLAANPEPSEGPPDGRAK